jgi:hypothetical protein
VTSGNLIVVAVKGEAVLTGLTITDTLSTSWTSVVQISNATNSIGIWAGLASSSGYDRLTISSLSFERFAVAEFSGVSSATADATNSSNPGTTPTTLSVTTTQANDLLVAARAGFHSADSFNFYGTGGWPDIVSNGSDAIGFAYQAKSAAAGSQSATSDVLEAAADSSPFLLAAFKCTRTSALPGQEGQMYYDTSGYAAQPFVYHSSAWVRLGVPMPSSITGTQ